MSRDQDRREAETAHAALAAALEDDQLEGTPGGFDLAGAVLELLAEDGWWLTRHPAALRTGDDTPAREFRATADLTSPPTTLGWELTEVFRRHGITDPVQRITGGPDRLTVETIGADGAQSHATYELHVVWADTGMAVQVDTEANTFRERYESLRTIEQIRAFIDGFAERGGGKITATDELWIMSIRKVLDGDQ